MYSFKILIVSKPGNISGFETKFFSFLTIITVLAVSRTQALATEVDFDEATLQDECTSLPTKLLERQFDANKAEEYIGTSNILVNTPGTELYRQYLDWYSGKCTTA